MDEVGNDLYEQQLFTVFKSCLTEEKDELEKKDLFSICDKLHLDGLAEELKLCICTSPDKQTISFQEFRDGLLSLLKKFQQGSITDNSQCIVQPYYDSSSRNVDDKKSLQVSSTIDSASKIYLEEIETNIITAENRLTHLWEKIKVYLKDDVDSRAIQFVSSCIGIPELPNQITESIFEKLDKNCDGLISFDEFVIMFKKRKSIEGSQQHIKSHSNIINLDVNTLDLYAPRGSNCARANESCTDDEEKVVSIPDVTTALPSSEDLGTLPDTSLVEVTNIICDELKSLNKSLNNDTIQSHIVLLRRMLTLYRDEQHSSSILMENAKVEKEKMRVGMLEANERANLLAQEIDEYQAQLERTREHLQKQNQQRYAEITKELSDQLNIEREMDAVALKSKDDQLQMLQKENHDMRNKFVNVTQDNQMLESENRTLLDQIDKLRQSNQELLARMKMLDAEYDEIQSIEAKQQEQVDFFVDRIKQLQSEVTLLRDENDELGTELESFKCHGNDTTRHDRASSSLAHDLQLNENQGESRVITNRSFEMDVITCSDAADARVPFTFEFLTDEQGQLDVSSSSICPTTDYVDGSLGNTVARALENILSTNTTCTLDVCLLRGAVSRLIVDLQSNVPLHRSAQDSGKSIASEFEMECEERAHESLRDLVVSKASKLASSKRVPISNSTEEDACNFTDQNVKGTTQSKTSLRDYPPRKEEHSVEQYKTGKEISSNIVKLENNPKVVATSAELQEIEAKHVAEKKQLNERCSELERSLDLLKAEYEECEDYWAAKLEEERQLFEQEQKISDDKLVELINKITEYEELISPLDKSKTDYESGRLSPIDEKFNLEQQYIDLEEEFEKWKIKSENDISQKNMEIGDLHEKLKSIEQPVTNDSWVQVPDEMPLPTLSNCKSSSASSIPSMNELIANIDLCDTNDRAYRASEFLLSNDSNKLPKQQVQTNNHHPYDECSKRRIRNVYKEQNIQIDKKDAYIRVEKAKEKNKCEFTLMQDMLMQNLKKIGCHCSARNDAQQRVCCVETSVLQNLNMKLYAQERKKRQLQYYLKRQQQHVEKMFQRIMAQHQTEQFELQCLLHNTQERLQIQVQTTIDQADRLANADILVKDLYIENACLTEHIKYLHERCLVLSGLNAETTLM